MHRTYEFLEKYKNGAIGWGRDAKSVLSDHVYTNRKSLIAETRGIEEKLETLCESVANISDLLISKGLITPDEFLKAIGMDDHFKFHLVDDN